MKYCKTILFFFQYLRSMMYKHFMDMQRQNMNFTHDTNLIALNALFCLHIGSSTYLSFLSNDRCTTYRANVETSSYLIYHRMKHQARVKKAHHQTAYSSSNITPNNRNSDMIKSFGIFNYKFLECTIQCFFHLSNTILLA